MDAFTLSHGYDLAVGRAWHAGDEKELRATKSYGSRLYAREAGAPDKKPVSVICIIISSKQL